MHSTIPFSLQRHVFTLSLVSWLLSDHFFPGFMAPFRSNQQLGLTASPGGKQSSMYAVRVLFSKKDTSVDTLLTSSSSGIHLELPQPRTNERAREESQAEMGCFTFKSGKNKAKNQQPVGAKTPPKSPAPKSDGQKSSKASSVSTSASTPTRSIQELSEERGAQRLRVFDLEELSSATNGFSRALKVGEGGFGSVYRAFFRSAGAGSGGPVVLAVKRLNQRSLQGHKQWLAEVQFLGVFEHPNLVKLIGYCAVDSEAGKHRLLVYEFMPNKSLDDHLFNRAHPPLPWRMRLQIMIGAARGLDYLHEGMQEVQVIYRDFKASNILLDADFKPKLSDFGLAREGPTEGKTHVSTAVVGTHGYAAPDYIETGHLTIKSDVWSFGVVLYEILTGRRSLERSRPVEEQKLLGWVRRHPPDGQSFRSIMDPRLGGRYPVAAAREVARLADRCLGKNPKERPAMREVMEELERVVQREPQPPPPADKKADRRQPPAKK